MRAGKKKKKMNNQKQGRTGKFKNSREKWGNLSQKRLWKRSIACFSMFLCLFTTLSSCKQKEEAKDKQKIQIGVTIYDGYDTFLAGYMAAFDKEINRKREEGIEIGLFRYNAAGSQVLQNEQVKEMLEKDCDVLCVNLVDRTAPSEIIDMAKKKNVPIIFFNRELVEEDLSQWNQLYYIGADAKQSGILQGEMAMEDILSEEVEKPTPEVPLASPEDAREVEERIAASREQAKKEGAVLGEVERPPQKTSCVTYQRVKRILRGFRILFAKREGKTWRK